MKIISKVFVISYFLMFCSFASAADTVIKVGVQDFEEYMPYSQYKNGEFTGFERDILDMFGKKYGYKMEYVTLSVKRLYADFIRGDVDLKMPDNEYWSADLKKGKNVKYSKPVVKYIDGVVVKSENIKNGVDKLTNLGIVMGFTPFSYIDLIKQGKVKVSENPRIDGLLKQVSIGRIDGGYLNISVAKFYMKDWKENEKLVFASGLPNTKSTRHLSSISHPEIIDKFNEFLVSEKSKIDELKAKYKIEDGIE